MSAVSSYTADLKDLSQSASSILMSRLLLAMLDEYHVVIESAPIESVPAIQAQMRQCRALLGVVMGTAGAHPVV